MDDNHTWAGYAGNFFGGGCILEIINIVILQGVLKFSIKMGIFTCGDPFAVFSSIENIGKVSEFPIII